MPCQVMRRRLAPDATLLQLHGELDLRSRDQISAAIAHAPATGSRTITLDLRRVTFIDAMAVGALVARCATAVIRCKNA